MFLVLIFQQYIKQSSKLSKQQKHLPHISIAELRLLLHHKSYERYY
jgi:hypothetical protein